MGAYLHGDEAQRATFVQSLGDALAEVGFAVLTGHGIPLELLEKAEHWVEEFFTSIPIDRKLSFRAARHGAVSEGYFPIKKTSDIHPDLVEGWVFGQRAFNLKGSSSFANIELWPQSEYEPKFRELISTEAELVLPIMQSLLSYLGSDSHAFDRRLAEPNFALRLNYYPPLQSFDDDSNCGRLLGHEDVDLFTLLPAPSVEGLQVLGRHGKWLRLNPPPGSIILNVGDYMQRLSNDRLPSTTHRVGRPRDKQSHSQSRVSFPLAIYLKPDELLEVLPELPNPKYEPIPVITFHTRTTAKFYGDDYAVEVPE